MSVDAARIVPVVVTALDADGLAVGALDGGRRVHVKGVGRVAADGSTVVAAQIVKRRRGDAFAIVEAASGIASAAQCPAYPRCGGCAIQHLDSAMQLALKRDRVVRLLDATGLRLDLEPTIVSGPQYHYRRRARLGVRHLRARDETLVGFRESFNSRVARIDACLVLAEPLAGALPSIQRALGDLDARARVPQVELAAGDDGGALVVRHLEALSMRDRARLRELETDTGLEVCIQAAGLDSTVRLDGTASRGLRYRLDRFGVVLAFSPTDFVQVNGELNRDLVATALALLAPRRGENVADLFCGIGNFTLPIARSGAAVVGVDNANVLVDAAQRNADANGLGARIELVGADLHGTLSAATLARVASADAALVDPPRSGIGGAIAVLGSARLSRLVYASCDATSFAADAARLDALGYRVARLHLFDMFPHTAHAETLALFERR